MKKINYEKALPNLEEIFDGIKVFRSDGIYEMRKINEFSMKFIDENQNVKAEIFLDGSYIGLEFLGEIYVQNDIQIAVKFLKGRIEELKNEIEQLKNNNKNK